MKNIACILIFTFALTASGISQSTADSLLNFIKNNKSKSALYLVQNDTVIAKLNENKMMPLASTVKIMVALEFAKQAGQHVFDENKLVPLKELNRYYLPNTDGNAHPQWLAFEKAQNHIINDSISLMNVARGMMMFSSNANTEYLMELLGLDNVKNNLQLLGVKKHTTIYPLVSSLFIYQNPRKKSEENILKGISKLNEEQYARFIYGIHKALAYDTVLKSKFRPQDLSMKMQKMWSDRLPASTVKEYAHIVNVFNNRRYFDSSTYKILSRELEFLMENPANSQWLDHAGMKGGSTPWVLTKATYATYATLKDKTRVELAYFFNDLTEVESAKLQKWMNSFELRILTDQNFRDAVTHAL